MIPRADSSHTLDFVEEYLAGAKAHILEVGCGAGRLAALFMEREYQVTAIDISPEAVEMARQNGVNAQVADLLQFESADKFDAVLFTSSLHHIHSLDQALERAKNLLTEKGRIFVEDFSLEQMDEKTAQWFYELKDLCSLFSSTSEVAPETTSIDPLTRWTNEHQHEPALHSRKAMLKAMETKFGNVHSSAAPYLYRYFRHNSPAAMQRVFEMEKKQIQTGLVEPIGLRIVAKKYFSYMK